MAITQSDGKLVVVGTSASSFALARYSEDGTLDENFGTGGKVKTGFESEYARANSLAIDAEGRIIVAGSLYSTQSYTSVFVLARYTPEGSLDASFGAAGKVTTNFESGSASASSLSIDTEGRIIVAGSSGGDFALARYTPDGSLDVSLDVDGKVRTDFGLGFGDAYANSLAIDAEGQIVVAGHVYSYQWHSDVFGLARFYSDGTVDETFGEGGKVTTDFESGYASANSLAIDAGGQIVVAGSGDGDFALARYTAEGNLDGSFGAAGKVTTDFQFEYDYANSLVIDAEGRIIAAGGSSGDFALARYTPNGNLDESFGAGGKVTTDVASSGEEAKSLATDAQGRVIVAGPARPRGTDTDFALIRYTSDGQLDPAFGVNGLVTENFSYTDVHEMAYAVLPEATDNKLLVFGYAYSYVTPPVFIFARYNEDGTLDTAFGTDGVVNTGVQFYDEIDTPVAVRQSDGKIVVAWGAEVYLGGGGIARFNPDGSLDTTFGLSGTIDRPSYSIALDAQGRIIASHGELSRYLPDGSLDVSFGEGGSFDPVFGVSDMAIDDEGRLLAVGDVWDDEWRAADIAVARYLPNGTLDMTFGTNGTVTTDFANRTDYGQRIAIDDEGRVVVAGVSRIDPWPWIDDIAVARFLPNGTLDTTFGTDGKVLTDFGSDWDEEATELLIDSFGRIVVVGSADHEKFVVARYTPSGDLDPRFGVGGMVNTEFFESSRNWPNHAVVDGKGRIVVVGSTTDPSTGDSRDDFALARYEGIHERLIVESHRPAGFEVEPVAAVQLLFNKPVDRSSFALEEDILDFAGPYGPIDATGFEWIDDQTLEIAFAPQFLPGVYELLIGPQILDTDGAAMDQDLDYVTGEPEDQYVLSFKIAELRSLTLNQQYLGHIEASEDVDVWAFSALADQQVQLDVVNRSDVTIAFDLLGPNDWVGFQNLKSDSDFISLPEDGAYLLKVYSSFEAGSGSYSFTLNDAIQTELTLGAAYEGNLVDNRQVQFFRLEVAESNPLQIVLDDVADDNRNELYLSFRKPPTRGEYDYRFSNMASADQEVFVPMAYAGTWYVLVYGDYIPTPSDYTLLATSTEIVLDSVTPDHHGDVDDAVLTLTGSGFGATSTVALVSAEGVSFDAGIVEVDSLTQITAKFAVATVPPGVYDVRVSTPDGSLAELPRAFEIVPGGEAVLDANLIVPSALGFNPTATLFIEYANTGDLAMAAPLLVLTATQDERQGARLTLDQSRLVPGFWTSANPEGFSSSVQILATGETPGVLQPGESFRVPVYYAGWELPWDSQEPFHFELGVLTADSPIAVNWDLLKDSLRPETISDEAWEPIFSNFTTQVGDTWGDYVATLTDNASYLRRLGERVLDIGQLLAFEFMQADGLSALPTLASSVDASVDAPGMSIVFSREFSQPISQRYELGPLGRGWSHNWQISLSEAADGTVTIHGPVGSRRVFQPDSRPGRLYIAQAGDYATLSKTGTTFQLQEPNGILYAFLPDGKLDYVEDTNSNRITAGYTGDLLTGLTHSAGQSVAITYNAAELIETVTDHIGRETQFTYDAANEHLVSVRDYDDSVTNYTYAIGSGDSSEHALSEIEFPGGTHQFYSYDALGRLVRSHRDGNAEAVTFGYDTAGRISATDALGNTSHIYLDHRGLPVRTVNPLGDATSFAYNRQFHLTQLVDPAGTSYGYEYDDRGNLVVTTDALGNTTHFGYSNSFNQLTSVVNANANPTDYGYDAEGDLTSITYADGTVETWTNDLLGNVDSWTNRRGSTLEYEYDTDGRLTAKLYPDGSRVDYEYDARGNLISATDTNGTITLEYFADDDRLQRITYPGDRWLEYTYDDDGRRESMNDQLGHRLDYYYDAVGRLESITDESSTEIVHYLGAISVGIDYAAILR